MEDLTPMFRELVSMQVLATAGGLRSVHRDPREEAGRTTGGRKLPDVTPLERAVDGGEMARARFASRVLARCPGHIAETLRWLADRAHAGDGDWARYLASQLAPAKLRDRAECTALRLSVAEVQRAALKGAAVKRSRKVTAEALLDAEKARTARAQADAAVASAQAEARQAEGALRAWGTLRLTACATAWAKARREVVREMRGDDGEVAA